jgi:hypothetical protein
MYDAEILYLALEIGQAVAHRDADLARLREKYELAIDHDPRGDLGEGDEMVEGRTTAAFGYLRGVYRADERWEQYELERDAALDRFRQALNAKAERGGH